MVIVLSGRKQAGKSSASRYIAMVIANRKLGSDVYAITSDGYLTDTRTKPRNTITLDRPSATNTKFIEDFGVKLYSFADPLKRFCIDVLGLEERQCYGSDDEKNSPTHIKWESQPKEILDEYKKLKKRKKLSGCMTGREVLEVFGTNVCRRMDENCWARALYKYIETENMPVAIVTDARFPNEISVGTELGAKAIRLTRHVDKKNNTRPETALDDFPLGEYSLVIDNENQSLEWKNQQLDKCVIPWLS